MDKLEELAKSHFGVTSNWNETGYILTDGTQLDFSGRHWGGSEIDVRNSRDVDHKDIQEIMDQHSDMPWQDFMNVGAIRIEPETGDIHLSNMPTPAQESKLINFISKNCQKEFAVDISDQSGSIKISRLYEPGNNSSGKILDDIANYFKNGYIKDSKNKGDSMDNYTFKLKNKKNDYDEYVVKAFLDGEYNEDATYYTDDWEDAVGTIRSLANQYGLRLVGSDRAGYVAVRKEVTEDKSIAERVRESQDVDEMLKNSILLIAKLKYGIDSVEETIQTYESRKNEGLNKDFDHIFGGNKPDLLREILTKEKVVANDSIKIKEYVEADEDARTKDYYNVGIYSDISGNEIEEGSDVYIIYGKHCSYDEALNIFWDKYTRPLKDGEYDKARTWLKNDGWSETWFEDSDPEIRFIPKLNEYIIKDDDFSMDDYLKRVGFSVEDYYDIVRNASEEQKKKVYRFPYDD